MDTKILKVDTKHTIAEHGEVDIGYSATNSNCVNGDMSGIMRK